MVRRITGREPFDELSPHTAVAQGAAIHAAILESQHLGDKSVLAEKVRKMLEKVRQENVNSHGLGVVATNPRSGKAINQVMIKRNTRLPAEKKQVFKTVRDNQERVSVQVIEGGRSGSQGLFPSGQVSYHRPSGGFAERVADRGNLFVR